MASDDASDDDKTPNAAYMQRRPIKREPKQVTNNFYFGDNSVRTEQPVFIIPAGYEWIALQQEEGDDTPQVE